MCICWSYLISDTLNESDIIEIDVGIFCVLNSLFVLCLHRLQVVAESSAMVAKCIVTVVMVMSAPEWGLYIFAASQVAIIE